MPLHYTEAQLADLIKGLEVEFTKELSKAEALSKSEDGEKKDKKPSESKPSEGEDKAPAADASAEGESEDAAPAAEAAPAEGEEAAAPAAAAAPAGAAPAAGHGYDEEDMQHMQQMYASMSREELMAHHDAVRAALDSMSAQAAPAAPAAPGAPAPAAPAAPGAPEMGKSERPGHSELKDENPELNSKPTDKGSQTNTEYNNNSGGKIEGNEPRNSPGAKSPASKAEGMQMEKSEKDFDFIKSELDAEKAKNADLQKNFDKVQEFLTKLVTKVTAPKGKAITEVAALAKNEDAGGQGADVNSMSKSEVTSKLLAKSQDPKTSPQDRAAINSFYLNGANINTISHLLK